MAKDAYGELSTDQEIKRGKLSIEDLIESTQVSEGSRPEKSGIGKQTMLDYFGFRSHPFADSLDLSFFYKSNGHEMALIKMQMSIEHDISFGLVTGKSGTGKTMISQALLERLSLKRFKPVLILATPHLSPGAFLKIIIKELTGEKDALLPRDLHSLVEKTSQTLLSYYQDGIKPVILIDETHFLSSGALHLLRTLSNFETARKKIMTCLLFAEEPFLRRLASPSYASLRNRMYLQVNLEPLTREECRHYIRYRLMTAGNTSADFFSPDEVDELYTRSYGIPRNINKECTQMMLNRFLEEKR